MKDKIFLLLTGLEMVGFGLAALALRDWPVHSRSAQTELAAPTNSSVQNPAPATAGLPAPKEDAAPPAQNTTGTSPSPHFSMREAYRLFTLGHLDEAIAALDSIIKDHPDAMLAYNLRGSIYTQKKLWDQARQDFSKALELDGKNSTVKFNLVEIDFMQKNYDTARVGFAALQKDSEIGDLAAYRVFLCDLFGGHQEQATQELSAFDAVGSNASYYYSHVAWDLYHQKTDDARDWLASATRIYPPAKNEEYASSLKETGYLPLPAALPK